MNKVVVAGGSHHNTLGVIRGLGERGIRPDLVLVSPKKKSFVSKSKYVANVHYIHEESELTSCLVSAYKKEAEKPVVICCSDALASEVDQNYNQLKKHFFLPGADSQGLITNWMSKKKMADLAQQIGLKIPQTWYYDDDTDINSIIIPCIIKPLVSKDGAKENILVFKERGQLLDFVHNNQTHNLQIQEFIEKDFEYQLIGCVTKEEVIIPGVSKILRPCKGSNTSFLHYVPLEENFCEIKKCKDFIRETGYHGLFSLEFLRDKEGKDYFLEVNFRNDGNAICVTAAGVSLPYVWYLDCIGGDFSREIANVINPIYVMPDMAELKLLLTRQISIKEYLSDLKKTGRFMEYDKNDPKPFWYLIRERIGI